MVKLTSKTESEFWADIFKMQLQKESAPAGASTGVSQVIFCAGVADNAIKEFRHRVGEAKYISAQELTPDSEVQEKHSNDS